MSADEKRTLFAMARADAQQTVDRAGDVLLREIRRLEAEIAAERARCDATCRHG